MWIVPVLTPNGVAILGAGALGLLVPFLMHVSVNVGVAICCLAVSIFGLIAVSDVWHAVKFFRHLSVRVVGERKVWFDKPAIRQLKLRFPPLRRAASINFNLAPPPNFEVDDVHEVVLAPSDTGLAIDIHYLPRRRGDHVWPATWLRFASRGAVLQFQRKVEKEGDSCISVYPSPFGDKPSEELVAQRNLQVGVHRYLAGLRGKEFDCLRRYQPGDDTRHIDWKRSAGSSAGLLLKTYQPETHQRVTVALDCGRRMSSRLGKVSQLDSAVNATARLIRTAISGGDEVGFFAFAESVESNIKIGKGIRHQEIVFRALRSLQPTIVESDYSLLSDWIGAQGRRSLLVIITSFSNAKSFETIRELVEPIRSRHVIIIVVVADRELESLSKAQAANIEDAYTISAAEEQLSDLRREMAVLRRIGCESIYADASDIGARMHEAYVRCKVSGRL